MSSDILSKKNIFTICFFVIIAMPFFLFLGRHSIQIWDEARNTLNLFEMYKSGNFLVTTYQGAPDMWNTKPPLLHWFQLLFVNIFGFSELVIRIPSAIAGFLTCVLLWGFLKKYTNNLYIAFLAAFVLATSNGFIDLHASRTADYDALLVLFTTINAISLFLYLETKKNKFLYIFFISLALGVLTKSIAILLLLPAYGLFVLFDRQLINLLKNKHFYLGIVLAAVLIGSFYFSREIQNPGYLKAVFENEIFGRYTKGLEGNARPFDFYFQNFKSRFYWWIFFLPIGFVAGFFNTNMKWVRMTVYFTTLIAFHFLIISSAETKLPWYELPEYPFLSVIVAIGLFAVYRFFKETHFAIESFRPKKSRNVLIAVFFGAMLLFPYYKMMAKVSSDKQEEYFRNNQLLPEYLKDVLYNQRKIEDNIGVCVSMLNHHYHTEYYIIRLQEKGINIHFADWKNLPDNQVILMGHDDELKQIIEEHYAYEVLESHQSEWKYWGIKKYRIIKKNKSI